MSDAIQPTSVQTSSEVAAGANLPAKTSADGERPTWAGAIYGILNFVTLSLRVAALAAAAAILKEQLHLLKARMYRDANKCRTLTGHLHQAGVDAHFQARTLDVATTFDRVAEASGELMQAADGMEANARGVHDAHETEYRGTYEIRQASPYVQPKPGFNKAR